MMRQQPAFSIPDRQGRNKNGMAKILIIEDDKQVNDLLADIVNQMGHESRRAFSIEEGWKELEADGFDLIVLDLNLPDGDGLKVLSKFREIDKGPEVIILTGHGSPEGAEIAIKSGAIDYITKPATIERIMVPVQRALEYHKHKTTRNLPNLFERVGIIGKSTKMMEARNRLAQAAESKANVLIEGESGTGKELFARAIHQSCFLTYQNFVVVDCTLLNESLAAAILFGHERGAYTGADIAREGLIKQADGGTLFLDEVGELPHSVQKAFLRALQEYQFRPVGAKKEIKVDFRLIAATNRNLDEMVQDRRFRGDLLYRLRTFHIDLPPLRSRARDIMDLAAYQVKKLCKIYTTARKRLSPEFSEMLMAYDWPGNVRELFNAIEESVSVARDHTTLYPYHLPVYIRAKVARKSVLAESDEGESVSEGVLHQFGWNNYPKFKVFRNLMEYEYLKKLMWISNCSKKDACRLSGLSRTRLFELLKKHQISDGICDTEMPKAVQIGRR